VPEPGEIIDALVMGTVMHKIWRRAAEETASGGGKTHRAAIQSEWERAVISMSAAYPLLSDVRAAPALDVLKSRALAIADDLDETEARARELGMRKLWTKTEMPLPEMELPHAIFSGRADRVDFWEWPEGEGAIIYDYKIGRDTGYGGRFQLASYAAALGASGMPVAGFCYLCHADGKRPGAWIPEIGKIFASSRRISKCGEKMEYALERMLEADAVIALGQFESRYGSASCGNCAYPAVCRKGEWKGEDGCDDD
jgi:hypothetical protein